MARVATFGDNGDVFGALPTLRLLYRSQRALDADHAAYMVHGGMLVPTEEPLPLNALVALELVGPGLGSGDELRLRLDARVGRHVPGRGLLLSFEPGSEGARADLDRWMASDAIREAVRVEESTGLQPEPPEVTVLPAAEEATDPSMPAPDLDEDTGPASPPPQVKTSSSAPPQPPEVGAKPPKDAAVDAAVDAMLDEASSSTDAKAATEVRGTVPAPFARRRRPVRAGDPVIRRAQPGERYLAAIVRYPTASSYIPDAEALELEVMLTLPLPEVEVAAADRVLLKLTLPGHNVIELWGVVDRVSSTELVVRLDPDDERFRRACLYPQSHQARNRHERELARGDDPGSRSELFLWEEMPEELEKMPLRRRLQRMGMEDKINLALSGNREERMALAQDGNKSIHHYLLKNAKLTLDEVAFMARLPSLNPDVLDRIAENPAYTQNPAVTKALVFNPRTPVRTSIRLLDRLPRSDLNILSRRTGMNKRLVMAAKNKMTGSKW